MFCSIYRFIALYEVSNVRFMEYECLSLSLSLSTFSLSHNENRRSLPDSYLLRNDIQYRMDAWSIILTPLSAVLIKICQHWRASCKLVSIASKTGIPPWAGQPKMQSRTNMGIFHDRPRQRLPGPSIKIKINRVSFSTALIFLSPRSVYSVFTYGFHSINFDSLYSSGCTSICNSNRSSSA